ncbi:hypothetical protein [Kitasatospora sp. NPDC058218]|uniref:hypothetical protein n=1 Tax=Kitasatospora sp. NPDC058218 TaxID=3346385 RepID=UPI0036DAF6CB
MNRPAPALTDSSAAPPGEHAARPGLLGRLGIWSVQHVKAVVIGWLVVVAGLGAFAPQVTSALSGPLPPKEMGIVLGVAVLLDAALVRLVLLPVLLRLTGRAAWHTPAWLDRLLPRIPFSHG